VTTVSASKKKPATGRGWSPFSSNSTTNWTPPFLRPPGLTDGQILERLVALNAARAAEETGGLVRWLRPENQAPAAAPQVAQPTLLVAGPAAVAPGQKQPWPRWGRPAACRPVYNEKNVWTTNPSNWPGNGPFYMS